MNSSKITMLSIKVQTLSNEYQFKYNALSDEYKHNALNMRM